MVEEDGTEQYAEMPLYWKFMPTLRASHATTTFTQQAAGADDWTACADPVVCMMTPPAHHILPVVSLLDKGVSMAAVQALTIIHLPC